MIPAEKDRMECLRLAVTLMIPKSSGMRTAELAAQVLDAARQFHQFVTLDEKP